MENLLLPQFLPIAAPSSSHPPSKVLATAISLTEARAVFPPGGRTALVAFDSSLSRDVSAQAAKRVGYLLVERGDYTSADVHLFVKSAGVGNDSASFLINVVRDKDSRSSMARVIVSLRREGAVWKVKKTRLIGVT